MNEAELVKKYTRMPLVPVTLLGSLPDHRSPEDIVRIATNEVVTRNASLEAIIERGICVGMFETSRFHESAVGLVYNLNFNRKLDLAQSMLEELEVQDGPALITKIKAHNRPRNRIAHRHDAMYVPEGKLEVVQRRASGGNTGPAKTDLYDLGKLDDLFLAARTASLAVTGALWPDADARHCCFDRLGDRSACLRSVALACSQMTSASSSNALIRRRCGVVSVPS